MNDLLASNNVVDAPSGNTSGNAQEYRSLIVYTFLALFVALFVRIYIAAPYLVSGASMDPSFETLDYLVIDRVSYRLEDPVRGDVIVFKYPHDPSRSFIKRIIGLPGETVVLQGETVLVRNAEHPEGFILSEPYIAAQNTRPTEMTMQLKEDQYFVMGDNRRASADSRTWGALPKQNIVGRALVRLFPFNEIDLLPGEATYQE